MQDGRTFGIEVPHEVLCEQAGSVAVLFAPGWIFLLCEFGVDELRELDGEGG